jgi:Co/Zn/Cd efflux system component
MTSTETDKGLRRAVLMVGAANLAYFFIEFFVARKIGSVSLFADSIDFFEDAAVNVLIFVALAWSARNRARAGMAMAGILLLPALSLLWTAWQKFQHPMPPEPWLLSATGLGALVVNVSCAFLLAKFRDHKGSMTRAAFLSARNDAFANIAIMAAGALTLAWATAWPDLIVGAGVAIMNIDAAKEIWQAAHKEHKAAKA